MTEAPALNLRFKFIDALRGVAALGVLLFHLELFPWGHLGVPVFFVISGFVIAASNAGQNITPGYVGRFILRRSLRLDPPYWLTLMLMIVCFGTPFAPEHVLSNMFYLHMLLRHPAAINVAWTLCQEVQLYLFFVISLGIFRGWSFIVQAGLAIVSMAYAHRYCAATFIPYWHHFFAGALCYWIYARQRHWALAVAYLIATASIVGLEPRSTTVMTVTVLLVTLGERVTTLGSGAVWQFFGRISYSLYLTHVLTNDLLAQWLDGPLLRGVSLVACIGVATVMYLLVERTAIRWSQKITKTSKRADELTSPVRTNLAGGDPVPIATTAPS